MKKILLLVCVMASFIFMGNVSAETFREGNFISGEYINKVKNGKTYYLTAQFIKDDSNDSIYCLEPFVEFTTGSNYVKYESDFENQLNLTSAQVRRIKLLGYLGYNYNGRTDNKWYVITQYLMWKTIDPSADIYFTDRLNGNRINKYESEINEIERDVRNYEETLFDNAYYHVPLGETLVINETNDKLKNYVIKNSDLDVTLNNDSLTIKNVMQNGKVVLKQKFDKKDNAPAIYLHTSSQKLFKVGKPEELEREINIEVIKGSIMLDIKDDDSVYTVESNFDNVCYGIFDESDKELERVCTNQELKYKKENLKMGIYTIRQLSTGIGYVPDENVYIVDINKSQTDKIVELKNKLIRNDIVINKSYCKGSNCLVEAGAVFDVTDKNGDLVKTLTTDNTGITNIELGYGSYTIEQTKGMEGYSMADIIETRIVNETDKLLYNINNIFIEKPKEETKVASVVKIIEEEPPETRADSFVEFLKGIIDYVINFFRNQLFFIKNVKN